MPEKIIEIRDLSYSYPDKTKALSDINFDVYEGESIGIIGPNGAGKTTLLLHLNGVLKGSGSVRICGMDVGGDNNIAQIRKNVGLVFQNPDSQLFMPTVFDDVAFGPLNLGLSKEEAKLAVEKSLGQLDMQSFSDRASHHLSLGEKKKISIATVLAMNPKILALDEPTSNMDPKSRREQINLLRSFSLTKIIVSHDLRMVEELCQRIIILDSGSIVINSATEDILKDETLLKTHSLELY